MREQGATTWPKGQFGADLKESVPCVHLKNKAFTNFTKQHVQYLIEWNSKMKPQTCLINLLGVDDPKGSMGKIGSKDRTETQKLHRLDIKL